MWKTFALPRVLYGLEVPNLRRSDTMQQRRLQCLPNNIVNVAVYCLLGARPVEQAIDYRKLSLHASILYSENTIEFDLAYRQIAIKGNDSNSWLVHCNLLLHKYKLLNIYNLKQSTNCKETLKAEIKHKIDKYVHQSWVEVSHISTRTAMLETFTSAGGRLIIILEMLDELLSRSKY